MPDFNGLLNELAQSETLLTKRQQKKVKFETFNRLTQRLHEDELLRNRIENEAPEFFELYLACHQFLTVTVGQAYVSAVEEKAYYRVFRDMTDLLAKKFDLRQKGTYIGLYMAIGIAIGAGFGMMLSATNSSLYSIGVSLGLVFGVSAGNAKEAAAIKAGKMY